MPRLPLNPSRVSSRSPNRCPDCRSIPFGCRAGLQTDAQIATQPQSGVEQVSKPMPRLPLNPIRVSSRSPNRCPDRHSIPVGCRAGLQTDAQIATQSQSGVEQVSKPMPRLPLNPSRVSSRSPNRCPDCHSIPIGCRAGLQTDAQIATQSQSGVEQVSKPMPRLPLNPNRVSSRSPNRCPDRHSIPVGCRAGLQTDAQIATQSQSGVEQVSKPMPRSPLNPNRVSSRSPNRCPDCHSIPIGCRAGLQTDAQIATQPQSGVEQVSKPMPRSPLNPSRVSSRSPNRGADQSVCTLLQPDKRRGLEKEDYEIGGASCYPSPTLLLPPS